METNMEYFESRPLESTDQPNTFRARHKLSRSYQLRAHGCLPWFQKIKFTKIKKNKKFFWKRDEEAAISVRNNNAISRVEFLNNSVDDIDFRAIMEKIWW